MISSSMPVKMILTKNLHVQEEIEPSLADPFSGRGSGRGRGRGRGRGEGKEGAGRGRGHETQMYATGAFGYGPAQQG